MASQSLQQLVFSAVGLLVLLLLKISTVQGQQATGVSMSLRTTPVFNNSIVSITDIGEGDGALLCLTDKMACCRVRDNPVERIAFGQWFFPDGSEVTNDASANFYRNRGERTVRLNRRSTSLSPTGRYRCEIPDATDETQILFVEVDIDQCAMGTDDCVEKATCVNTISGPGFSCECPPGYSGDGRASGSGCTVAITVSTFSFGNSTIGERFILTCMVSGAMDVENISLSWFGPPTRGRIPQSDSDTRMVSRSGSTLTLMFNPIQSSDDGNYICAAEMGSLRETGDFFVIVQEPVITAMVIGGTPTVGESYSFTCTVTGANKLNPTITYQWFKDNTVISGETQSILSIPSLRLSDAGQYRCDVTVSSTLLSQPIIVTNNTYELNLESVDINECNLETDDCVDDAICLNTDGSFICICPPGFTGDGRASGTGCTDIDECTEGTHNCGDGSICVNTPGLFVCDDINECAMGTDDCVDDATCTNTDGSFTCTCSADFIGDGRASGSGCTEISFTVAPSGINTAGEQYQLTCTFAGIVNPPTITWTGPPNGVSLPSDNSDTRMVSDVMSSGSTHTSILQFDPLQSSHEGNYTCLVTVQGTVVEMRSIEVNVEEPVITAMVSGAGTLTVGESYSITCTVTGADKLNSTITYQWFKDNTVISGETQSTLFISSLRLSDAGQYRCDVTVNSTLLKDSIQTQSNVFEIEFPTEIFQVRFEEVEDCQQWISTDTEIKSDDLLTTLVQAVEGACDCGFTRDHITEDAFQCFPESPKHVTFRARLTQSSAQATTRQLITHIESWVMTNPNITINNTELYINDNCSTLIDGFDSPECPVVTTLMTTTESTSSSGLSTGAVIGICIGAAVAGLIVIILLVLVIAFLCVICRRKRNQKQQVKFDSQDSNSDTNVELEEVKTSLVTEDPEAVDQVDQADRGSDGLDEAGSDNPEEVDRGSDHEEERGIEGEDEMIQGDEGDADHAYETMQ